MNSKVKTVLIKYGSCTAFAGLMMAVYFGLQDFSAGTRQDIYRWLCDGFSIPGALLVLFGALVWASNEGAFTGVSYCLRMAAYALIPGQRRKGYERYGDYVARKSGKKTGGYGFLFFYGGGLLAVAAVFLILFYLQ